MGDGCGMRDGTAPGKGRQLPTRHELHLTRKVFHAVNGTVVCYICRTFPMETAQRILIVLTVGFIIGECMRLFVPKFNEFQQLFFGSVMREHEANKPSGIVYFLVGCLLTTFFFPANTAALSALLLGWGDPIASAMGIKFGKFSTRVRNKTMVGMAGFFVVALVLTLYSWSMDLGVSVRAVLSCDRVFRAAFVALTAAMAELLAPFTGIDDNFIIPLAVAWSSKVLEVYFS